MKKAALLGRQPRRCWHAQLAWHDMSGAATEVIGVPKNKAPRPPYTGGLCWSGLRLTGDFSPSSQSCSSASASQAASMRLNRLQVGSFLAVSARSAQFCALSLNRSDCFVFMASSSYLDKGELS